MVEDRIEDGRRIAQLLSSELAGRGTGRLADLAVVDADPGVEPTADGAFAYGVDGDTRLADAYVQPDRAYLELRAAPETGLEAAADAGLRARPKAVEPPRALLFVESGVEVKRAVDAIAAVARAAGEGGGKGA